MVSWMLWCLLMSNWICQQMTSNLTKMTINWSGKHFCIVVGLFYKIVCHFISRDPSKLKDSEIEDYLQKFAALASANGGTNYVSQGGKNLRDDEQALHILLQCGNNCEEALRRRQIGGAQPSTSMSIWSEEECKNFEAGIRLFGKYFHEIQASKVSKSSALKIRNSNLSITSLRRSRPGLLANVFNFTIYGKKRSATICSRIRLD